MIGCSCVHGCCCCNALPLPVPQRWLPSARALGPLDVLTAATRIAAKADTSAHLPSFHHHHHQLLLAFSSMRVLLLLAFSALTQGATVHRRQESSLTSEMSSSMMDTSSSMTQTTSTMLENTSSVSKTGSAMPTATAPPTPPSPASLDVTVLKFALTLERLEATFYALGLQHFNEAAMVAAGLSALQAAVVVSQMRAFLADESTHVAVVSNPPSWLHHSNADECL